jgi:hypothetical protein
MLTFKEFRQLQEETDYELEEGWKDYVPSMKSVSTFGRNFADKASLGTYKYVRAGADTVIKKALGRKTTYNKELEQEKQKLARGEKDEPGASVLGDVVGTAAVAAAPGLIAPVKAAKETGGFVASLLPRIRRATGY